MPGARPVDLSNDSFSLLILRSLCALNHGGSLLLFEAVTIFFLHMFGCIKRVHRQPLAMWANNMHACQGRAVADTEANSLCGIIN